jgi:hypothetical protein
VQLHDDVFDQVTDRAQHESGFYPKTVNGTQNRG